MADRFSTTDINSFSETLPQSSKTPAITNNTVESVNLDTYIENLDTTQNITLENVSYTKEELEIIKEEYLDQYQTNIKFFEELLEQAETMLKDAEDKDGILLEIENYLTYSVQPEYDYYKATYTDEEMQEKFGITQKEFSEMSLEEFVNYMKKYDPHLEVYADALDEMTDRLLEGTDLTKKEDFETYKTSLENDIAIINLAIEKTKEAENNIDYNLLELTEEYQNFETTSLELDKNKLYEDGMVQGSTLSYTEYCYRNGDVNPLEFVKATKKMGIDSLTIYGYTGTNYEKVLELSDTYPEFEKKYSYLYETKGKKAADKYLENVENDLNMLMGQKQAQEFLSSLEGHENAEEKLENHLKTTGKGILDGMESWAEGVHSAGEAFASIFGYKASDVYSVNEYETMYILQALQEEEYGWLDNNYELSQSAGNLLPSVTLGILLTPGVGTFSVGVSAGGNSYHGGIVEGYSNTQSIVYGVTSGCSEALLQKYAGNLLGLNDVNITSLKTFASSMVKEGKEEFTQEWIDAGLRKLVFDEDIDAIETIKASGKSAFYGAFLGGVFNSPNMALNRHNIKSINKQIEKGEINESEIITKIKEQYGEEVEGLSNEQIITEYSREIMNLIKTNQIKVETAKENVEKVTDAMEQAANQLEDTIMNKKLEQTTEEVTEKVSSASESVQQELTEEVTDKITDSVATTETIQSTGEEFSFKNLGLPENILIELNLSQASWKLLSNQYKQIQEINSNKEFNNYSIELDSEGKLVLPEGALIHGTKATEKNIKSIAEKGILSGNLLGIEEDGETFYCADFFRVPTKQSMQEYHEDYTRKMVTEQGAIMDKPQKRYLPDKYKIAFVINPNSELSNLTDYDYYRKNQNFDTMENYVNSAALKSAFSNETVNNGEGLSAILGGMPVNSISGVIVGSEVVKDTQTIELLKEQFPNQYIADVEGNIIYTPTKNEEITLTQTQNMETKNIKLSTDLQQVFKENPELELKLGDELLQYLVEFEESLPETLKENFYSKLKTLKLDFNTETNNYNAEDNSITIPIENLSNLQEELNLDSDFIKGALSLWFKSDLYQMLATNGQTIGIPVSEDSYNISLNTSILLTLPTNLEFMERDAILDDGNVSHSALFMYQLYELLGKEPFIEAFCSNSDLSKIENKLYELIPDKTKAHQIFEDFEQSAGVPSVEKYNTMTKLQLNLIDYFIAKLKLDKENGMSQQELEQECMEFEKCLITLDRAQQNFPTFIDDSPPFNKIIDLFKEGQANIISDESVTIMSSTDLIELLNKLSSKNILDWIDNEMILDKIAKLSTDDFYELLNKIDFSKLQKNDGFYKILELITTKYNIKNKEALSPKTVDTLRKMVPEIVFVDEYQRKILQDFNTYLKEITQSKKNLLQKLSPVKIEEAGSYLITPLDENYEYYDIIYEIDGREYQETVQNTSSITWNEFIDNPEILNAALEGRLEIKAVKPNIKKSELVIKNGIEKGIYEITLTVDGKRQIKALQSKNGKIDLNKAFPNAQNIEVENIKQIGDQNIKECIPGTMYQLIYNMDGEYVKKYLIADNWIGLNINEQIEKYNLHNIADIKIQQINKDNFPNGISLLEKFSSAPQIFSAEKYGGNQSDVADLMKKRLNNEPLNLIDQQKAETLDRIITDYFPDATAIEKQNIAERYAESGCGYMAIANAFATYMGNIENGDQIFKNKFGFDLTITDEINESYNLEALALDMCLDLSKQKNYNIDQIIGDAELGLNYERVSDEIVKYFKAHGVDVTTDLVTEEAVNKNGEFNKHGIIKMLNNNAFSIINAWGFDLERISGEVLENNQLDKSVNGQTGDITKNVGGHGMLITELDNNDIIVSSWSGKYRFLPESIEQNLKINRFLGNESGSLFWTIAFDIKEEN